MKAINANPHNMTFDILAAKKLNKMSKSQKVQAYIQYGFTEEEALMMIKGSTYDSCIERLGFVWFCGNIPFEQAVSKEHAEKLYYFNFREHVTALRNGVSFQ
jgi:hypothetical protein